MSRRITLLLLTASVVTLAQPASADSECFDQSCRMPGVAEPPTPVETPMASETTGVVDVVPPAMEERPAMRARPQMVVDPAPRHVQHEPRYSVDAGPRRRVPPPAAPAPRYVEEPGERVRVVHQGPNYASFAAAPSYVVNQGPTFSGLAPAPRYHVNQGPVYSGPGLVVVPPVYEMDGVAVAYPHLRADPAWKLCQMDRRTRAYAYCTPYSYHPYGAQGYRPYGTYGAYHGDSGVAYAAPSARIIQVGD